MEVIIFSSNFSYFTEVEPNITLAVVISPFHALGSDLSAVTRRRAPFSGALQTHVEVFFRSNRSLVCETHYTLIACSCLILNWASGQAVHSASSGIRGPAV